MNNNELFVTLISSLTSQAWIQLGKIKNPVNDKIEKNLEAASMSIDMLTMIKDKTKNNLEEYESKLLEQSLNDLRMNFVFEKNKKEDSNEEKNPKDEKKDKPKKKVSKKK
jgi:type III secretory pathway component EscR